MPFGAAISAHPVTAHATGEVVGQVVEQLGLHPDLAVVAVTPGHAGALEDAAGAVRTLLQPSVLLGWVTEDVTSTLLPAGSGGSSGGGQPLEAHRRGRPPAIGLWAGLIGPVMPVRLAPPGPAVDDPPFCPGALLIVGAPGAELSVPTGRTFSAVPVGGAVSDVERSPVALDGRLYADGAVGVLMGPGVTVEAVVEDGRRPIGPAYTASRVDGPLLLEVDGQTALAALEAVARDHVPAGDIPLINQTLHLQVSSPTGVETAVRGVRRDIGALATDPPLAVGDIIRFSVRDPTEARHRGMLRLLDAQTAGALAWTTGDRRPPSSASARRRLSPLAVDDEPAGHGTSRLACRAARVAGASALSPGGEVSMMVFSEP